MVAQDALKAALVLNAIDPLIGGVLIRGQKGTGKSTAARAIARLLPSIEVIAGCPFNSSPQSPFTDPAVPLPADAGRTSRPTPFVELPLNATEDRLAGTLEVEQALQTGRRHFEAGLLASANRGILYVDEVNLLDDHLVDLLLDAASSGVNVVEREGFSFAHPARFLLIGTMNPEEGELRPQFLDRFGLCVTAERIAEVDARELIVRRRLEFDHDPEAFQRRWAPEEALLAAQIVQARKRLAEVAVPDAMVRLAVRLTHELDVAGHRADLTVVKGARAHAAFLEKPAIDLEDLQAALKLALPHRIPSSPLDSAESLQQGIDQAFRRLLGGETEEQETAEEAAPAPPPTAEAAEDWDAMAEQMQVPGYCAAGSVLFNFLKKKTRNGASSPTSD
jgi:Mg-chelatase subunit ChlI